MKTQKLVLSLIIALAIYASTHYLEQKSNTFQNWKAQFRVKYQTEYQNLYRGIIFNQNLIEIQAHNANLNNQYQKGVNQFTALSQEEFAQTYLMSIPISIQQDDTLLKEQQKYETAADIDWVASGAVTQVNNQGQCGACWAFSAVGGLEGLSKIAYGKLQNFSEQQLIDCSIPYGNMGCNGGLAHFGYDFVKQKGIVKEQQYKYSGVKQDCLIKQGAFKISGNTAVDSCSSLQKAILSQPISVAVDAANWMHYSSGVFKNCKTSLNHNVLLVGIKSKSWVVKNSWGTTWGEKGYMRLEEGNTCGICNYGYYPNK